MKSWKNVQTGLVNGPFLEGLNSCDDVGTLATRVRHRIIWITTRATHIPTIISKGFKKVRSLFEESSTGNESNVRDNA